MQVIMSDQSVTMIVRNTIAPYGKGIAMVGIKGRKIKSVVDGNIHMVAGSGVEGNANGKAESASFSQPFGICVEWDKNIFVTDSQTGSVKVITTIKGIIHFLRHLGVLYSAFSVHLKHQSVPQLSLDEAVERLKSVEVFFKESTKNVLDALQNPAKPNGTIGTISSQTLLSVQLISQGLQDLRDLIAEIKEGFQINLHTCLTVQVENLHATGHFKDQFPTMLQYARNLSNTVYESIKRVVNWAAHYYTHERSYYRVLRQATPLNALPRMSHLRPSTRLSNQQKGRMVGVGDR